NNLPKDDQDAIVTLFANRYAKKVKLPDLNRAKTSQFIKVLRAKIGGEATHPCFFEQYKRLRAAIDNLSIIKLSALGELRGDPNTGLLFQIVFSGKNIGNEPVSFVEESYF